MATLDIFSKRQKTSRGELPDVYTYDRIPDPLRVQIIYILRDAIGDERDYREKQTVVNAYRFIVDSLCREYGTFELAKCETYGQGRSTLANSSTFCSGSRIRRRCWMRWSYPSDGSTA